LKEVVASYAQILVTACGSGGGGLGLRGSCPCSDLEPIDEFYALNDLWQLVVAIEPSPGFLRTVDQLEDHGEGGIVRQATF
jgi:hypothetical protein